MRRNLTPYVCLNAAAGLAMLAMCCGGLTILGSLIPMSSWAAEDASSPAKLSLTLRLFNTSSASARDLEEMRQSASQVFDHSGVEIEWIACEPGPRDSAVCPVQSDSAGRTIIFVRLVDEPIQPKRGGNQLHRALLGRANHDSSSVAVFYRSACAMEQDAPQVVTKGQILGHALAHEIGHLLLASDAHSLVGIMKENYSRDDLFDMGKGHLLFAAKESRVIRKRILTVPLPLELLCNCNP
jgi:hypothetical protein